MVKLIREENDILGVTQWWQLSNCLKVVVNKTDMECSLTVFFEKKNITVEAYQFLKNHNTSIFSKIYRLERGPTGAYFIYINEKNVMDALGEIEKFNC